MTITAQYLLSIVNSWNLPEDDEYYPPQEAVSDAPDNLERE